MISINREKPSAAQIPTAQIEAEEVAETAQGLSEEIVAKLDAKNTQLTQSRKKLLSQRKEKLAGVDKLHNYSLRFKIRFPAVPKILNFILFKTEKSKQKILPIFTEKTRYYQSIFRVRTIPDLSLVALTTWSLFTTETLKKLSLPYQVKF